MAQINVKLSDEQVEGLRSYAAARRTPVAWLIKDYIDYLLHGGIPLTPSDAEISSARLVELAQRSHAFDWLTEEPELYSLEDGEAV